MVDVTLVVVEVVAGLALFLFALGLLTRSLKEAGGRRFRRAVAGATVHRVNGFLWGVIAGAAAQSMAAISFVLVGMLRSGLMTVERAIAIVAGANVGAVAIIFVTVLDVRAMALLAIGVGGLAMLVERWQGLTRAATILFAFGVLLFGLRLMQDGAAPLMEEPSVRAVLDAGAASYFLAFLVGALLTIVIQSSVAVGVLAAVQAASGVLDLEQVIMVVYGSNLGSSILTAILSFKLRGRSLQIAMIQILFNTLGCVVLVPLFYLEVWVGVPGIVALLTLLPGGAAASVPVVWVLFNIVAAVIVFAFPRATIRACELLSPAGQTEDVAQPEYISEHALVDADLALSLARLEMVRLIDLLPRSLEAARASRPAPEIAAVREGEAELSRQVGRFLEEVSAGSLRPDQADGLSHAMTVHRLVDALGSTVSELAGDAAYGGGESQASTAVPAIVEAADVALMTLAAFAKAGDVAEAAFLSAMTSTTGETMTRIRRAVVEADVSVEERVRLLRLTNLFERLYWQIGGVAASLRQMPGEASAGEAAGAAA